MEDNHNSWGLWIKTIETCFNEIHHDTPDFTPIEIHLNIEQKRIWEKCITLPENQTVPYETKLKLVEARIKNKGLNRVKANKNIKRTFENGTKVMINVIRNPDKINKITKKFLEIYEGPYIVHDQIRPATYILKNPTTNIERGIFNIKDLKPYIERT